MIDVALSKFQFPTSGKVNSDYMKATCINNAFSVSIPYEREGKFRLYRDSKRLKIDVDVSIPYEREGKFRLTLFPTQTGRGCVYPKTKRELRGAFFFSKLPQKSHKPLSTLTQTRFFSKNGFKVRHPLGSWAIYAAFAPSQCIALVFTSIPQIRGNVKHFYNFLSKNEQNE